MALIQQLKLLINLAGIDGQVAPREQTYIRTIGIANGLSAEEIDPLFDETQHVVALDNLNADEKFDIIFSLVQLMKIDERLYQEEIKYCSSIAARLGYDSDVMFELMLNVRGAAMHEDEIGQLKNLIRRYIKTSGY